MSLLKQVSVRLKSVGNIQKITKSMKMVSASKFMRAERDLKAARPFGYAPRKFYQSTQLVKGPVDGDPVGKKTDIEKAPDLEKKDQEPEDTEKKKKLKRIYIAVTSDRGLCGGVHSGIVRRIKQQFVAREANDTNHKLVCIGEKSRVILRRSNPTNMLLSASEVGRLAPVFLDACTLAAGIADAGYEYDTGEIYYNKYHSPAKYELSVLPVFTRTGVEQAPNISAFDEVEGGMLQSYVEWTLAALIYFAMKDSAASEQSARMVAMTNATKNAEEMLRKLKVLFNRTRQAVITRELIEIISGAAALK